MAFPRSPQHDPRDGDQENHAGKAKYGSLKQILKRVRDLPRNILPLVSRLFLACDLLLRRLFEGLGLELKPLLRFSREPLCLFGLRFRAFQVLCCQVIGRLRSA